MKIRYKAPSGPSTLDDLPETASVSDLLAAIRTATGYNDITVKYGWPPRPLSATEDKDKSVKDLGLHKESLIVAPVENAVVGAYSQTTAPLSTQVLSENFEGRAEGGKGGGTGVVDQGVSVKIPENGSELVLRVMPDDNSCLFTSISGCLRGLPPSNPQNYSAQQLRQLAVTHIRDNPSKYTKVILEAEPAAYCQRMLRSDTWGGAIELGIFSELFEIEICSVDVKTGNVYRYGDAAGYAQRCILVYSNIHYDRIAEVLVPGSADLDFEVVRWDIASSDGVLVKAQELCRVLRDEHHYFTDTSDFLVKCNAPGCQWIGQGEKSVFQHLKENPGHTDISEIPDPGV